MTNTSQAADTPLWDLPTNHDRLAEHVELAGKRAVDVGSGAGALVRFMRSAGADSIGVECGESMIAQARAADPEHTDCYLDGVGQDLPIDDESVDVVVFSYSLHHVPGEHMATALTEADRVLRTGGTLAVLEPIPEGPGYETHRPIDDEAEVRALAQAALDNDLPPSLSQIEELRYTASYSYGDFSELHKTLVDIDPTRSDAFDAVEEDVRQLFHEKSVHEGDRFWFAQPVLMRLFTKA